MNRVATGICVAAAFGIVTTLGAQTSTTSATTTGDKEIEITGCLERGASGGFVLTSGTAATSSTTTASATTSTTESNRGATEEQIRSVWHLEGHKSDLDKHVGQRVTVTGHESDKMARSDTTTASTTTAGTSGSSSTTTTDERSHDRDANARRLEVKSVKLIASSCS